MQSIMQEKKRFVRDHLVARSACDICPVLLCTCTIVHGTALVLKTCLATMRCRSRRFVSCIGNLSCNKLSHRLKQSRSIPCIISCNATARLEPSQNPDCHFRLSRLLHSTVLESITCCSFLSGFLWTCALCLCLRRSYSPTIEVFPVRRVFRLMRSKSKDASISCSATSITADQAIYNEASKPQSNQLNRRNTTTETFC